MALVHHDVYDLLVWYENGDFGLIWLMVVCYMTCFHHSDGRCKAIKLSMLDANMHWRSGPASPYVIVRCNPTSTCNPELG